MAAAVEAIIRALDYIEDNLKNNIGVLDVCRQANYSLYHFIRIFEGLTGHTPKDYILRRRVREAAADLGAKQSKIIDIAYDYQFNSPEVFARAFKRITGLNPSAFEGEKPAPVPGLLNRIDRDSLNCGGKLRETEVEVAGLDEIRLAGLVSLVRRDKSLIDELWQFLYYEMENLQALGAADKFYGHSFWSNEYDLDGFFLLCGIETAKQPDPGSPFCLRTIPAGRYLLFVHQGDVSEISLSYKYIFQTYLPKTDYVLSKPYDFEIYYSNSANPHSPGARTEILLPVE